MSVFQFKQFAVKQEESAMKIGTDSVLLGCFCEAEKAQHILDVGTGTGLLSLMLAQKSTAKIDAVEIDAAAFTEATFNINSSPWQHRIRVHYTNFLTWENTHKFDLIISNPPYYKHKQQFSIADEQRSKARHDKDLPFTAFIDKCVSLLHSQGQLWLVLPTAEALQFKTLALQSGLHLNKLIRVYSKPNKLHNREIMCWSFVPTETQVNDFTIYDTTNNPTEAYKLVTADYYLWKEKDNDNRLRW